MKHNFIKIEGTEHLRCTTCGIWAVAYGDSRKDEPVEFYELEEPDNHYGSLDRYMTCGEYLMFNVLK
jgi:hypothetical protein